MPKQIRLGGKTIILTFASLSPNKAYRDHARCHAEYQQTYASKKSMLFSAQAIRTLCEIRARLAGPLGLLQGLVFKLNLVSGLFKQGNRPLVCLSKPCAAH